VTKDNHPEDLWDVLKDDITESRRAKIELAADNRTNQVRLVVQDVHDPHNVSACMRSAEAMGLQKVDVVTLNEPFRTTTVARGVKNWLEVSKFKTVKECADQLHKEGFLICAGMPATGSMPIDELPVDETKPLALLFGNEHAGVSPEWKEHVDLYFTIPMAGLVESMNISVCAAISMHHMTHKSKTLLGPKYFLSEGNKKALLNSWAVRTIDNWEKRYERLKK
jgi:tRNA (guanosine-2'-O-)-methyltransferase